MLPDGSGIESAAATPGVPTFTPAELHKQLDAVLGKGASGTVYSLRDFPGLAVKEVRLDGLGASALQSLRFELATLTTLTHPGILRYHQVIEDDSFIYIVMDRHDGTLECLLIEHKRKKTHVSNRLICSIARQVAGALAYLHGFCGTDVDGRPYQGVIHRDLKPANVLMSKDGERVVIADFGLCKDALRSGSTFAGTPSYMAPETLLSNKTSRASDIWALGVIIYELATLKRPNFLEGKEPKDVFINGWKPDLSPVKDDFIRSILERIFVLDPAKRPTARELAELFQAHRTSSEGDSPHTTAWEAVLKDANARIAALERELHTNSSDICSLRNTITTQTAEIDSLRKELKTKSAKIDALEQQFTRAIEALEEKTHRRETEMDQQLAQVRAEADQHKKELDEALKAANNKIASLEKELATKSIRVDTLEQQLTNAIKKSDKLSCLTPIQDSSWTPLMRAAASGNIEAVKRHLADKDKKNSDGDTALTIAARAGQGAILELLDPTDKTGVTTLMRAAGRGDVEAVRALMPLQKGRKTTSFAHINRLWIHKGGTALMMAAAHGRAEVVRLLVEHEGGMRDEDGWTALMLAADNGHADCAELLLKKEGGVQDKNGMTALMHAVACGHADCVRLLLEKEGGMQNSDGWTALMRAGREGHADCVRLLLKREAGMRDKDGWTALMRAVLVGHTECVRLLAEEEKDMKTTRRWCGFPPGTTALGVAEREGRTAIASILSG